MSNGNESHECQLFLLKASWNIKQDMRMSETKATVGCLFPVSIRVAVHDPDA